MHFRVKTGRPEMSSAGGLPDPGVGNADVQGCRHRVVADIRRVVTGAADPSERRQVEPVIETGHVRNGELRFVEHPLAAGDRLAPFCGDA